MGVFRSTSAMTIPLESSTNKNSTGIIVLGMHRSGTSALTGVLSILGINPGSVLSPAIEDVNPKGFWEHSEIVSIHDQLLDVFGSSWDDELPLPALWWTSPRVIPFRNKIVSVLRRDFGNLPVWLIKDPRMCRLLPLWQEIFSELNCHALYILALRDPAEVTRSLHKRDDLAEAVSCLLWLTHMLEAEFQTRGQPRAFVSFERLLSNWQETVADLGQTLSLSWPLTAESVAPKVNAFLDPSLRHHSDDSALPDHQACRLARKGFELLSAPAPAPVELDKLRAETAELISLISPWSKPLHDYYALRTAINIAEQENAVLRSEVARIKNTVSWKITKPLRALWNILRKIAKVPSSARD